MARSDGDRRTVDPGPRRHHADAAREHVGGRTRRRVMLEGEQQR
jgi:hypothetical protein